MQTADHFDPYHKWLGIAPAEQPPTLYRLLGLQPFESDPDVIHSAADRQSAYLRTVQAGQHASHAAQLLNYVASARICLTDPQQRANYDAVLKSAAPAEAADNGQPAASTNHKAEAAGTSFGAFEILELVRKSQFGDVYKAQHRDSGRLVSLKLLPASSARHREVVRRFDREQKVNLSLSHPNLIAGYAAGVHDGQPYLVTEYVVGTDLATLVSQRGSLPVEQAVDYIVQAARGLTQLHMHGVYHRNIKPHVLYVDMQGQIKVTSLFLARLEEFASVGGEQEELTRMGQVMGTAEFMAPEQALDAKHVDGRADIYALGCTLHYLLTARPPYDGNSMMDKIAAHSTKPIPDLTAIRRDVPRRVQRVFQRMLSKEPNGRYPFMGDVVSALEPKPRTGPWQSFIRWWSGLGQA